MPYVLYVNTCIFKGNSIPLPSWEKQYHLPYTEGNSKHKLNWKRTTILTSAWMLLVAKPQDPRPALSLLKRELAGVKERLRSIHNKLRLALWLSQKEERQLSPCTRQIPCVSPLRHLQLRLTPPEMGPSLSEADLGISALLYWKQVAYHLSEKRHQGGSRWFAFFSFESYFWGFRCGNSFFVEIHCLQGWFYFLGLYNLYWWFTHHLDYFTRS